MKTGTITFHAPNNNGSFLQAYALQTVLQSQLGIENEIIDFYSEKQIRQYSVFRKPKSWGDVGRNLISLMHYNGLKSRYRRFNQMRKKFLTLSQGCATEKEVYEVANAYDTIICGSDQIWNTEARDYSDVYFMPDVKKKKISYAASFGSNIESIDKITVKKNLLGFEYVSVREKAGRDFIKKLLPDERVEFVCDPTLLLEKNAYSILLNKENIEGSYIFLYTINYSKEILQIAQKLSQEMQIPVYAPFTGYSCVKCRKYGIKILYDVGPAEFLWLIENATCTCSNSFHGIAFSVIFEKQFCRPVSLNKDGTLAADDRIDNLLNQLNLNERTVSYNSADSELMQKKIDYFMVKEKLDKIRSDGICYLKTALLGEGESECSTRF